jgi:hypothetical protein
MPPLLLLLLFQMLLGLFLGLLLLLKALGWLCRLLFV